MITNMVATTRVPLTGAVNAQIDFGLISSEYTIENIGGLGPVAAELTSSEGPSDPGGTLLSTRTGQRNIVILMGFAPRRGTGSTVESLRRALRKVFTPEMRVTLTFVDSVLGTYDIQGVVESNEPDIFSKDPQSQISIICGDPFFKKQGGMTVFNIPPLTPFNERFAVPYDSDVATGFVLQGDLRGSSYILLQDYRDSSGDRTNYFRIDRSLPGGSKIRISTIRGERGAWYTPSTGGEQNAIAYLTGSLVAMNLRPGLNYFALFPTTTPSGSPPNGSPLRNATISYPNILGSL